MEPEILNKLNHDVMESLKLIQIVRFHDVQDSFRIIQIVGFHELAESVQMVTFQEVTELCKLNSHLS